MFVENNEQLEFEICYCVVLQLNQLRRMSFKLRFRDFVSQMANWYTITTNDEDKLRELSTFFNPSTVKISVSHLQSSWKVSF